MNRWPDGRELTDDDLLAIAEADGKDMAKLADHQAHVHNTALFRSHLLHITQDARYAMFWAGKLTLDTRPRGSTT